MSSHATHIACSPGFSLLSSQSTGYILPPPPSCSRSAACNPPVYHLSTPIPSAMSRDLACALHSTTLSLICWGDAPLAQNIPLIVVCIPDDMGHCTRAAISRGEGGYQLAPRLYDSSHSDGRYFEVMPVVLRGVGGALCDSSTDVARISVLSVSSTPWPIASACDGESCSCAMYVNICLINMTHVMFLTRPM